MSTKLEAMGYLAHIGPLQQVAPDTLALQMQPNHLNIGGRLHGGIVMALISAAAEGAALAAVAQVRPGACAEMLTLDVHFVSAALEGSQVQAQATPTRVTRTMVFLTVVLNAGEECLATAQGVYRIVSPGADESLSSMPVPSLEGWDAAMWREPFARHIGVAYERTLSNGFKACLFQADPTRLCSNAPLMHDGMALFVADVFTGRASSTAAKAQGRCVTLNMQVRRFGDVPAGAWVEFRPKVRHLSSSVVFTDGTLVVGERPVMAVSSVWKVLGAS